MNKRLFVLLVILMSLSLIGIIFVQSFWIKQSVDDKEEQFSNAVIDILNEVTDKIERRERRDYSERYLSQIDSLGTVPTTTPIRNIMFIDKDLNSNEIRTYSHGILEEDYNIASTFFDSSDSGDTTTIKNYTSKRTSMVFKENFDLDGKNISLTPIQKIEKIGGLTSLEKAAFDDVFMEYAKKYPFTNVFLNKRSSFC